MENGSTIDVSAELNRVKFEGAQGLGKFLHDEPRVPACLVRNVYAYGVGRAADERDEDYLARQAKAFAGASYRLPDLMGQIASSPEFFRVEVPGGIQPASRAPAAPAAPLKGSTGVFR
jgi:hypothetical protein